TALSLVAFGALSASAGEPSAPGTGGRPGTVIDYNRQVRPILSNNCFQCHGPDADQRESGLRLDVREAALQPADSGKPAVVPGRPDQSGLVRRVSATKKGTVMPPPSSNKTLTAAEKQLLKDWIAQGAAYQTHWSFLTPKRPTPPTVNVKHEGWVRNPIDRF